MSDNKSALLNELKVYQAYIEEHFDEIGQDKARKVLEIIHSAWPVLERRATQDRRANHANR